MAVKVTLYGTSNMRQFERGIESIKKAQMETLRASGGFRGSMAQISYATGRAGDKMKSVGDSMTKNLTLPLAAAAAGMYKASQNAALDAQAQVILAGALKNNANATKAQVAQTEEWISAQGKLLGVADDQLRPALATLVGATKDVSKAQRLASLAMDVAAARGVPVETAAKAIGKAYAGQTSALTRLVPGIDATAVKSKNLGAIMASVNGIVGGQAAAAANTQAGAMARNKVAMDEAIESLGYAFLPIIQQFTNILQTQVVPTITKVADWFGKLDGGTKNLVVGVGAFVAILGPSLSLIGRVATGISAITKVMALMKVATIQATVAKWAENAAWLASPTTWIIAGIMALIAAIVLLWRNNEGFRNFIIGAWGKIKSAFAAVFNWVKSNWPLLLGILTGPIGMAVLVIARNWDKIKAGAQAAWNGVVSFFRSAPQKIVNIFKAYVSFWLNVGRNIVEGIKNGITGAWGALTSWFRDKIGGMVDSVKSALGISSPSKVFHGIGVNVAEGMANGIKQGAKNATAAASNMAGDVVSRSYAAMAKAYAKNKDLFKVKDPFADMMGTMGTQAAAKVKSSSKEDPRKAVAKKLAEATKSFMGSFGIGEIVKTDALTPASMLEAIKSQVAAKRNFVANVSSLRKAGLAAGVISSLLAAGPAQAGAQASALAGMTSAQLKDYNAAYRADYRYSKMAAQMQTNGKYAPNITISPGAVQVTVGSDAQKADVQQAVDTALNKLVRELRSK